METSELTFASLDERIEESLKNRSHACKGNSRETWGAGLILVAGLSFLLIGKTLPPSPWVVALLLVLLVAEISGLIIGLSAAIPEIPKLRLSYQRREFARTLDSDMPCDERLFDWLRAFQRERLQAMSDYAAYRLDRYRSRMPVVIGSVDKLGVLPVLAAVVIQFKNAAWPPQISWWQIPLFAVLAFIYWVSVLAINQRLRLKLYDALLKKALA